MYYPTTSELYMMHETDLDANFESVEDRVHHLGKPPKNSHMRTGYSQNLFQFKALILQETYTNTSLFDGSLLAVKIKCMLQV